MALRKRPVFCPLHELNTYNCDWTCAKACADFGYWSAALDKHWLGESRDHRGIHNPNARLHTESIPEIRRRSRDGESGYKLAAAFGVDRATIYSILSGHAWRHVA